MQRKATIVRRFAAVVIAATVALVAASAAASAASARVLIVTQRHVSYTHFTTIQAAVNAAHRGDWILIAPGVYDGTVQIKTPDLHLRGMNRNKVIIDGRHHVGNGIVVTSSGVWIENLTVRNFDRRSREDSANGNEVWWKGAGPEGTRIGIHGWWGQYLTAYDTGLLGGYGLYAGHSVDGWFKHVYASGFNDSGVYVGRLPRLRRAGAGCARRAQRAGLVEHERRRAPDRRGLDLPRQQRRCRTGLRAGRAIYRRRRTAPATRDRTARRCRRSPPPRSIAARSSATT